MFFVKFDCLLVETQGAFSIVLLLVNFAAIVKILGIRRLEPGEQKKFLEGVIELIKFEEKL